jgi:hypothetical protein
MRVVAAVVAVSVMLAGCFPHNARYRTYSKWAEAGSLVAGIALAAAVNTGADCDTQGTAADSESSCKSTAAALGYVAVGLIVAGLLGFVATVSTAEDEDGSPAPVIIQKAAGSGATAAGSAAPTAAAPSPR